MIFFSGPLQDDRRRPDVETLVRSRSGATDWVSASGYLSFPTFPRFGDQFSSTIFKNHI